MIIICFQQWHQTRNYLLYFLFKTLLRNSFNSHKNLYCIQQFFFNPLLFRKRSLNFFHVSSFFGNSERKQQKAARFDFLLIYLSFCQQNVKIKTDNIKIIIPLQFFSICVSLASSCTVLIEEKSSFFNNKYLINLQRWYEWSIKLDQLKLITINAISWILH